MGTRRKHSLGNGSIGWHGANRGALATASLYPSPLSAAALHRPPKVGAECNGSARSDLSRGQVTRVPTGMGGVSTLHSSPSPVASPVRAITDQTRR